jgi:K+-sensing histidine kinase KdpD
MDSFFKNSYLDPKAVRAQLPKRADLAAPSEPMTVALAISGSIKSKNVIKWALNKFGSDKNVTFKLIHIHPKITTLPTASGNIVSISEELEEVAAAYRQKVMQETKETLLKPFKKMCERKKVAVELQVLESNSVAVAITKEVNQHLISNLIIGRSSQAASSRNYDITASISASVSNLCTVYVVSNGGVHILAKDTSDTERNDTSIESGFERTSSSCSSGSGANSGLELSPIFLPETDV